MHRIVSVVSEFLKTKGRPGHRLHFLPRPHPELLTPVGSVRSKRTRSYDASFQDGPIRLRLRPRLPARACPSGGGRAAQERAAGGVSPDGHPGPDGAVDGRDARRRGDTTAARGSAAGVSVDSAPDPADGPDAARQRKLPAAV